MFSAPIGDRNSDYCLELMLAAFNGSSRKCNVNFAAIGAIRSGQGSIAEITQGTLVLDGLIYDRDSHRSSLSSPTANDAEILAQLIVIHGITKALSLINGDFAFVWVERASGSLWLARDPMGMRPLFYTDLGEGSWAVSSQPRGLLKLGFVNSTPSRDFLVRYGAMHYRMIDSYPETSPYAHISQVPSATLVGLHVDGQVSRERYWNLLQEPDFESSEIDLAEEYRSLFLDSVRLRLSRHANRAFTLSGGMDSSSVLAASVLLEGETQTAFSTLYQDGTYDERDEIRDMLSGNVSNWHRVLVPDSIDIVGEVDRLVAMHDEPVATATWLSHMLLSDQAAALGFQSLFGGLGGDELNAGEYEYFPFHFADLRHEGRSNELVHEIEAWAGNHDHPIFRKSPDIAIQLIEQLSNQENPGVCLPDLKRMNRYVCVLTQELRSHVEFNPVMETVFTSYLKNRTWQDLSRETLPCCIRAEDRHGYHYGLSPVLPFLDKRLVEFMYRVPGSMKIRDGVTKRLLRQAMKGILPDATRLRVKKSGWNAPAHLWFYGSGADILRDLVNSQDFVNLNIYDRGAVLDIIDDHERIIEFGLQRENHMMFLWQFLNIMRWQHSLTEH